MGQPPTSSGLSPKKLGLALGGGGARGLAHAGVLKVLDRERIPIAAVAGSSMGGLIGALYCSGRSGAEIAAEIRSLTRSRRTIARMFDVRLGGDGLVAGRRIVDLLAQMIGAETTFADLPIPFAATAVDLLTGREVNLMTGRVIPAVRATISIPGIFTPVELGPYRLIDGGVLNNLPVDVVPQLGAETVIAVDVTPNLRANRPGQPPAVEMIHPHSAPKLYQQVWQAVTIMIASMTETRLQQAPPALILRPQLPSDLDVLLGFTRAEEAIAAGEAAAEARIEEIRRMLSNF